MRRVPGFLVLVGLLAGCAAPYDDDGELSLAAGPAVPKAADAVHVVVDTDLGGDDLAALALLVRHPDVVVEAVTISGTGLVGCDPGVDVVADLFTALEEPSPVVACGPSSSSGRAFPDEWRRTAASGSGIPRPASTVLRSSTPAPALLARYARHVDDLTVVALGPLTNLAALARSAPDDYERLSGVHVMGGSVHGPLGDGVAEWNAAADPAAFSAVLASDVPVVVVPEDAVPSGTPSVLSSAPGVAGVAATMHYEKWWDLAAAAAFVTGPGSASVEAGDWTVDGTGRLTRAGDGSVGVLRPLDAGELQAAYGVAFG